MAVFSTGRFIPTDIGDLRPVADEVVNTFQAKGYDSQHSMSASGYMVSISKGGTFKAVLGMKTALNVDIKKTPGGVTVNASIGVFGQQVVPTLIVLFIAWPVILPQIWGLVQQSKLDNEAVNEVEQSIRRNEHPGSGYNSGYSSVSATRSNDTFCHNCGGKLQPGVKFCNECGTKQ